jgi:hypothetical protein
MRYAWLLLAAVLAGCGSVAGSSAEGSPIRAVDRPAPGAHKLEAQVQIEVSLAPESDPCEEPTAEDFVWCEEQREVERIIKAQEEQRRAQHEEEISPVEGSEPRVVAELPVRSGTVAELIAWQARNGKTCTLARVTPEQTEGFGAMRVGACVRFMPCTELCLTVLTTDDRDGVLAGTVPQHADVLRLIGPEGKERDYELDGPVIDGSDLRVFIADLGDEDWWTAELRRGDEVLGTDERVGSHLRGLRCANESTEKVYDCYSTPPLLPEPAPTVRGDEPELSCERQFDDTEAGFQTCEDEGEPDDSE